MKIIPKSAQQVLENITFKDKTNQNQVIIKPTIRQKEAQETFQSSFEDNNFSFELQIDKQNQNKKELNRQN